MKKKRQAKIMELITQKVIETQEELSEELQRAGFSVTQATISRDIREMKLVKVVLADKRQCYAPAGEAGNEIDAKYLRILQESYLSMDVAQNILVIKTGAGLAMAVAAALDGLHWHEIVGCIAGDDTVMCAIRTTGEAKLVMKKIKEILNMER